MKTLFIDLKKEKPSIRNISNYDIVVQIHDEIISVIKNRLGPNIKVCLKCGKVFKSTATKHQLRCKE